jgi:phosphate:Na+ symporter
MSATEVIIRLLGEVSLMLWGIHMVRSGVLRALGGPLRRWMARGLGGRTGAFAFGAAVTLVLQSSTATAMMATSFAGEGAISLAPALAIMLGANVGSALIVQAFSFDISLVFPIFLFAGLVLFRRGAHSKARDLGRAAIGVGLVLLALNLLKQTAQPAEGATAVRELLRQLTQDPALNLVLAAVLTLAAHSSVAIMLFVISLSASGVLSPAAALAMTLGANLGGALNPLLEASRANPLKLRLAAGNFTSRLVGCALALPLLAPIVRGLAAINLGAGEIPAAFHLAFNGVLALAFMPLLPLMERLLTRVIAATPDPEDPANPKYLARSAIESPVVALTNAARESLRAADAVEAMLRYVREAFLGRDRSRAAEVAVNERVVHSLNEEIEHYLSGIDSDSLSETDGRRLAAILNFNIAMKRSSDLIQRGLMRTASRMNKAHLAFSPETLADIDALHARLVDDLRLCVAVFATGDIEAARKLAGEKEHFRDMERAANERRQQRVRAGIPATDSGLDLDVMRDLKAIAGEIVATAYPTLEQSGMLRQSRLA